MATLFFTRKGKGPYQSSPGYKLPIEIVTQFFNSYDYRYFQNWLIIDPDFESSPLLEYRYVVVEILSNEINEKFPKAGFYWFHDLSPKDCEELIKTS